ncbi:hypothetical protein [Salisediminibacterium beveridgei]|uniref:Peptidase propeptide and YPEB domain-containing protein n=1 Tax=Salisediminibacterium beveridgei TaxID=632773 RepID=A0A1D7QWY2_9BACI|nr:hypothetical protein [Salisediminibacterium beveridgei]AOM83479.1 hypothetical protein BBEV_2121 [Salisediminibacterium beveridgei]
MERMIGVILILIAAFLFSPAVAAAENNLKYEDGVDPNHMDVTEAIHDYVEEHLEENFAGRYIDRDERDLGVIVYLFTEMPGDEHVSAMEERLDEDAELAIQVAELSEDELNSIQQDIDSAGFNYGDFEITHTASMIQDTAVEVGIKPYSDENAQVIYDEFGSDYVNVVEGEEATDDMGEDNAPSGAVQEERQNLFNRIIDWFRNLF